MRTTRHRVFYNSHATEATYDIIRARVPEGFELVTLSADDDAERRRLVAACDAAIVAATPLTGDLIDAAANLRLVHHQGVGFEDTVDWRKLAERSIPLALTPAGTTTSVAEHAVMLILASARCLAFADSELRAGRWHVNSLRPASVEISGKTVGYIGMGRIGRATSERLRAFQTKGLYFDPNVALPRDVEAGLDLKRAPLDEVLARSDIVTLHLPGAPENRHMIDAQAISRMKRGVIIVNTSRGSIVDEAALCRALQSQHVGAAGLDVFENEPLAATNELVTFPNVVLTPHISAGTRDALDAKMAALFANMERFFTDGRLENQVDYSRHM